MPLAAPPQCFFRPLSRPGRAPAQGRSRSSAEALRDPATRIVADTPVAQPRAARSRGLVGGVPRRCDGPDRSCRRRRVRPARPVRRNHVFCRGVRSTGDRVATLIPADARFEDLRMVGGQLPQQEAGMLAYARGMTLLAPSPPVLRRLRRAECEYASAGHVMRCTNAELRDGSFPAPRSGDHRAGHRRRARVARPAGVVARGALFDHRRVSSSPAKASRTRSRARCSRKQACACSRRTITRRSRGHFPPR